MTDMPFIRPPWLAKWPDDEFATFGDLVDAVKERRRQREEYAAARSPFGQPLAPDTDVIAPLCLTGRVGPPDGCTDFGYCLDRKQPMCGGHTTLDRNELDRTPNGRRWLKKYGGNK